MADLDFLGFHVDFDAAGVIAAYDEAPLWSAMFGLLLLDHVPLAGHQRVLDVGCGTGFPTIELAERLGPAVQVHGLDTWAGGVLRAAEKVRTRRTPNVTLHRATANAMPFRNATFDLMVSNLGLNNFDDRAGAMRECRRVARPGATLALTTNLQGHMEEFYGVFDEVLAAAGDADGRQRLNAHVGHRATVESIRALLHDSGFSVVRVVDRVGSWRLGSGTALLNHYFIKLGFLEAWKAIVPGREVEMFLRLRQRLNETARTGGGLSLKIPMAYVEAVAV